MAEVAPAAREPDRLQMQTVGAPLTSNYSMDGSLTVQLQCQVTHKANLGGDKQVFLLDIFAFLASSAERTA